MTISRRQALGTLGSSVIAASAGACANETQTPSASQGAAPPAATSAPASELRIVFTGLQLFVVEQQKQRIVVAMPKAAPGVARHTAQLAVIGGSITDSTSLFSNFTAVGLPTHAATIDGYRLKIDGGTQSNGLQFDSSAPMKTHPANADEWKSLRHIPEFNRLHPNATLKKGWDSGTHCLSTVEITSGYMAALPGFDTAIPDTILQGEFFTHYSTLRVAASGTVKLHFESLTGSANRDVEITPDNTGPLVAFLTFAPVSGSALDHGASIAAMFDGLDQKVVLPMSTAPNRPSPSAFSALAANTTQNPFLPMFDMLSDGTPSCPPYSFWTQ